jgi:hypothetical protein
MRFIRRPIGCDADVNCFGLQHLLNQTPISFLPGHCGALFRLRLGKTRSDSKTHTDKPMLESSIVIRGSKIRTAWIVMLKDRYSCVDFQIRSGRCCEIQPTSIVERAVYADHAVEAHDVIEDICSDGVTCRVASMNHLLLLETRTKAVHRRAFVKIVGQTDGRLHTMRIDKLLVLACGTSTTSVAVLCQS